MRYSGSPGKVGTVTINPALDHILTLPGFRPGALNRAVQVALDVGGKGTHVAVAAKYLGIGAMATGVLAGPTGRAVADLLAEKGVETDFVWAEGFDTRNVHVLIHPERPGEETMITEPGFPLPPAVLTALEARIRQIAAACRVVVFAGNTTPGLERGALAGLISAAKEAGAWVILDADGSALQDGLAAKPNLIKPNLAELERVLQRKIRGKKLLKTCRELGRERTEAIVLSMGGDGALLVTMDGGWRLRPPRATVRNTVGCGDAMVGGIAAGICRNLPLFEAVRLGVAVGALKAAMPGTTLTPLQPSEIDLACAQVRIEVLHRPHDQDSTPIR